MIELCGLWINESSNGEKHFSGKIGNAKVLIFKNKYKKADNHPEYKLFIAPLVKPGTDDEALQDAGAMEG